MMAQNTCEDKEIADLESHETTKPSESVGAIGDFLKPFFYRRDQLPKPSTKADGGDYFEYLGERGKIYDEALETARPLNDTRSEAEREEKFREIEGILVDEVKKDFQTYPKGLPECERIECWAATLGLVNIVVALVERGRFDQPRPLLSGGLLALAIAAENNDFTMVDALKNIAVDYESFYTHELDSYSPVTERLLSFYTSPVYELYPTHEVWLYPIEAAARLGHVAIVSKLIDFREQEMEAYREMREKELSEMMMKRHFVEASGMKKLLSEEMTAEKRKYRRAFDWAVRIGHHEVVNLLIDRECIVDLNEASDVGELLDYADGKSYGWRQTPLSLAVLSGHFEVVKALCEATKAGLRTDAKIGKGRSAIQMAFKTSRYEANYAFKGQVRYKIWQYIMERADSQREVNKLSPPIGYSSPPGTNSPLASVEGYPILEIFWVFYSLSFFFSMATLMVGANVTLPPNEHEYIGDVVQSLRWKLRLAYCLVSAAVFLVIGAFASAGFAVLPPIPKYTVNMAVTVGIGVTVVAVVVLSTSFGHMFTAVWQQLKHKMLKHKMKFSDD